jgi:predicted phosphodiesterase
MAFYAETISDTHLNMWKYTSDEIASIFPGLEPNLILAGDIGDPDEVSLHTAINIARQKYKRVIYVLGNHEFYTKEPGSHKNPGSVLSWFQKLDDQWDNFHFFYRRSEVFDGVRILGATGWTTSPRQTTWANTISEEGRKDIAFLEDGIRRSKEPVLVVTHYPSTTRILQDNFKDVSYNLDYAHDLERLYHYPVHTWIFGHVHQKHDFHIPYSSSYGSGSVRVICNPYGYPNDGISSRSPLRFNVKSVVKYPPGTSYRSL